MQPADEFDEFYKSTRTALLQQTFALTGDLPASRGAVRDAFVAAWHHWRKVSRLDDRGGWVRPLAWRHAQRRHSARIFHRDRKLDPDIRATLDALAKLPLSQRKVLLLTHLTDVSMPDIAREVGLTLHDAEQRLQLASSQLAMQREVPTTGIRPLFEPLRAHVADTRWPRVTIIRRAGTTRRRAHTAVGAVAVVGALVLGGAAVTDAQGVKPSLENARANGVAALRLAPGAAGSDAPRGGRCGRRNRAGVGGRRGPRQPRPAHGQRPGPVAPGRHGRIADRHPDALPVHPVRRPGGHLLGRAAVQGAGAQGTVAPQHGAVGGDVDDQPRCQDGVRRDARLVRRVQ